MIGKSVKRALKAAPLMTIYAIALTGVVVAAGLYVVANSLHWDISVTDPPPPPATPDVTFSLTKTSAASVPGGLTVVGGLPTSDSTSVQTNQTYGIGVNIAHTSTEDVLYTDYKIRFYVNATGIQPSDVTFKWYNGSISTSQWVTATPVQSGDSLCFTCGMEKKWSYNDDLGLGTSSSIAYYYGISFQFARSYSVDVSVVPKG